MHHRTRVPPQAFESIYEIIGLTCWLLLNACTLHTVQCTNIFLHILLRVSRHIYRFCFWWMSVRKLYSMQKVSDFYIEKIEEMETHTNQSINHFVRKPLKHSICADVMKLNAEIGAMFAVGVRHENIINENAASRDLLKFKIWTHLSIVSQKNCSHINLSTELNCLLVWTVIYTVIWWFVSGAYAQQKFMCVQHRMLFMVGSWSFLFIFLFFSNSCDIVCSAF